MYVIGKDSNTDKLRRNVNRMSLLEKKKVYFDNKSWLLYYKTCYELGEITEEELIKLRKDALSRGNI